MTNLINKILLVVKNILLPILLMVTIFIVNYMFQRIGKKILGEDLIEFILVILPFILIIILNIINIFFNQKAVKDNIYYNVTSTLVVLVISIFCIRALFDKNMYFLHKYGYNINFNYFSDQIAAMKVMLYGLSLSNILLMFTSKFNEKNINIEKK